MNTFDLFDSLFLPDNILSMKGTYEERKVDNTILDNGFTIDTVKVFDNPHPYETAVIHDQYYDCDWSVIEEYDTKEEAVIGHKKWIKIFQGELPEFIEDISTSKYAEAIRTTEGRIIHKKDNKVMANLLYDEDEDQEDEDFPIIETEESC